MHWSDRSGNVRVAAVRADDDASSFDDGLAVCAVAANANDGTVFDEDLVDREAFTDFRAGLPRFTPENRKANRVLVDRMSEIGKRKQATPAQIALAWILAQRPWIVPIPGTTKRDRLEENIGATNVALTAMDLSNIENAVSAITVQGERYSPQQQARIDR